MITFGAIISDLEINSLEDLHKLKPIMEATNLKVNKSQIARELNIDRRTVEGYIISGAYSMVKHGRINKDQTDLDRLEK